MWEWGRRRILDYGYSPHRDLPATNEGSIPKLDVPISKGEEMNKITIQSKRSRALFKAMFLRYASDQSQGCGFCDKPGTKDNKLIQDWMEDSGWIIAVGYHQKCLNADKREQHMRNTPFQILMD